MAENDTERAKDLVKVGLEHLRKSGNWNPSEFGLPDLAPSDVATKVKNEDSDATLYDRMTPAERTQLYNTNPDEFARILKAKEEAGYRKLINNNRPY